MSEQVAIEIVEASSVSVEVVEEAGVKVVEIIHPGPQGPSSGRVALTDTSTPGTIYVGFALPGTAQTTPAWTITRSQFNAAGIRTGRGTASGVTWANRATHSYQ